MSGEANGPERIAALLEDPAMRARLAEVLAEELAEPPRSLWSRLQPFLAGLVSGVVTVLAFFLPSIQEQWDRYQTRRVIDRYVEIGHTLVGEARYEQAEQAFSKALELSENKRLDIEEERLKARVERVNADPTWAVANPEGLEESDFLYLLAFQDATAHPSERAATLSAYGAFLAGAKRTGDAERALREAISLAPHEAAAHLHLGNSLRERGAAAEAEAEYRKAIAADPGEAHAHYDLGLLLAENGRAAEAADEFRRVVALEPEESDGWRELGAALDSLGRKGEAEEARGRARKFESPAPPKKKP
jgi:Flp pilus assembly protein TadD